MLQNYVKFPQHQCIRFKEELGLQDIWIDGHRVIPI